jgi:outer membrane protein assembly factor BamB
LKKELRDLGRLFWYRVCIGLAVVAALFTLTVAVVLTINHSRLVQTDPLNARSLQALRDRVKADPQDEELKEEIRQLDLLARRAWFGSVRFQERGIYLLLAGSLLLVITLKTVVTIRARKKGRGWKRREDDNSLGHLRWAAAAIAIGIAAGAVILAVTGRPPPETILPPAPMEKAVPEVARTGGGMPEGGDLWAEMIHQWPSFRGPGGLARAGNGPWPVQWDGESGSGIVWKTEIPLGGGSSPIVWGDQVFLSGADEEALEVYCFDTAGGELLWRYKVKEGQPPERPSVTSDTGHAAPTMATDGERVYAIFSTGDLVALDPDGRLVWQKALGLPDNPYGHASSLITYGDLLIVLYDHWAMANLMAIDGATGDVVWETIRDMDISWTSPIWIHPPDGDQLVVSGNPYVAGYDPLTGDELWRVAALSGEVASSPSWAGSLILSANEYATLAAISLEGEPGIVWEYGRDLPEVSSVLATGERVYMANGAGTISCLDQKTGKVLWNHEFEEGFYSSPVLADGSVYLLDRSGTMQIFTDADSYQPVASSALGETANCTAAFADGRIYLRGEYNLYCIGEEAP